MGAEGGRAATEFCQRDYSDLRVAAGGGDDSIRGRGSQFQLFRRAEQFRNVLECWRIKSRLASGGIELEGKEIVTDQFAGTDAALRQAIVTGGCGEELGRQPLRTGREGRQTSGAKDAASTCPITWRICG